MSILFRSEISFGRKLLALWHFAAEPLAQSLELSRAEVDKINFIHSPKMSDPRKSRIHSTEANQQMHQRMLETVSQVD